MAIEQSLMRLLKVQGGLTHGRGVTDSQLAYFVLSFPGCLKLCEAVERLTGVSTTSTEQHVDLRDSRRDVYFKHTAVFKTSLEDHSPYDKCNSLKSLSSDIEGDRKVNCHKAFEVGNKALKEMTGKNFADVKLTRKSRVLSLAAVSSSVKVRDEVVPVDTQ